MKDKSVWNKFAQLTHLQREVSRVWHYCRAFGRQGQTAQMVALILTVTVHYSSSPVMIFRCGTLRFAMDVACIP